MMRRAPRTPKPGSSFVASTIGVGVAEAEAEDVDQDDTFEDLDNDEEDIWNPHPASDYAVDSDDRLPTNAYDTVSEYGADALPGDGFRSITQTPEEGELGDAFPFGLDEDEEEEEVEGVEVEETKRRRAEEAEALLAGYF